MLQCQDVSDIAVVVIGPTSGDRSTVDQLRGDPYWSPERMTDPSTTTSTPRTRATSFTAGFGAVLNCITDVREMTSAAARAEIGDQRLGHPVNKNPAPGRPTGWPVATRRSNGSGRLGPVGPFDRFHNIQPIATNPEQRRSATATVNARLPANRRLAEDGRLPPGVTASSAARISGALVAIHGSGRHRRTIACTDGTVSGISGRVFKESTTRQFVGLVCGEWAVSRRHLVKENDAKGPNIAANVRRLTAQRFGRHVKAGARQSTVALRRASSSIRRQAKHALQFESRELSRGPQRRSECSRA